MRYLNRHHAGRELAGALHEFTGRPDCIVLALPRGGVIVGFEIAMQLHVPLDILVVRKLGVPWNDELAFGAIASGGVRALDEEIVRQLRITPATVEQITARELQELRRRERVYRGRRQMPSLAGKTVILTDDGLATGATMLSAIKALRLLDPQRIVVAVPVGSQQAVEAIRRVADECICPQVPEPFFGVGAWYADFRPTSDEEVLTLLHLANARPPFASAEAAL
jgi:putative phosphoribosyl transferase